MGHQLSVGHPIFYNTFLYVEQGIRYRTLAMLVTDRMPDWPAALEGRLKWFVAYDLVLLLVFVVNPNCFLKKALQFRALGSSVG